MVERFADRKVLSLVQLSGAVLFIGSVIGQTPAPRARLGLGAFVKAAEGQGAQLDEERGKLAVARAKLAFAQSQAAPSGNLDVVGTYAPGAEGNAVNGRTRWDDWGPVFSTKIELVQPLFTFGALSAGRAAGRAGLQAETALLERDRWVLRTQVAELYYGYQYAFELRELADDIRGKLEGAIAKLEKNSKAKADDLDKLKFFYNEAQVRVSEADKGVQQARMGMAWKIGILGDAPPDEPRWDRGNLQTRIVTVKSLQELLETARRQRPEYAALRHEVEARRQLANVEEGLRLPTIFAVGRAAFSHADKRQNQSSPFANDPGNETSAGAAVGVRWNVNFFEKSAKVAQARAEVLQAEGKMRHLQRGILADVEKNFWEVQYAMKAVGFRAESAQGARRSYQDALVSLGLGVGANKGVFDTLSTFVSSEKSRLEAIYQNNLALVRLEQSTGAELGPL